MVSISPSSGRRFRYHTELHITGGRSAFATVRTKICAPESPSASSSDSSEDVLGHNENSFLALSDESGALPIAPKSVVEIGSESVRVRLEKGEVLPFCIDVVAVC